METWELLVRESVRHTIAAYNAAGDRGRLADLAACFTLDGSLVIGDDAPLAGRDGIVRGLEAVVTADPHPSHVHHHVSSTAFASVARDEVRSSSYFTVMTDCGVDHWGTYRDRFVPVEDRWLLAERRVRVYGFSEGSYFGPTRGVRR